MPKGSRALMFEFACLFAIGASAGAAENVSGILRRQTQEMVDAIATGGAAVWDRYLDEGVRYVDESGAVLTKKQMVEGTKPPPGRSPASRSGARRGTWCGSG